MIEESKMTPRLRAASVGVIVTLEPRGHEKSGIRDFRKLFGKANE